ncbi:MAG: ferritin, partial [Methanobrevibacter sp.]|nr:ferritin [Methanobrevibacter sp.]
WESPLAAFQQVLDQEKKVTGLINDLVDIAIEEKEHATNNFLQWFVEEQVEEEENAMENLAKLKLAGDDNSLLYKLNEEFAGRGTAE